MKDEKARFFAQYIGLEVEYTFNEYEGGNVSYTGRHISKLVGVTCYNDYEMLVDTGTELYYASEPETPMLLLNPLSAISDEDAIEVAKMFDGKEIKYGAGYATLNESANVLLWYDGEIITPGDVCQNSLQLLSSYDFLRSKGYALPFMQYSVEQLVQMGWVKLKTD